MDGDSPSGAEVTWTAKLPAREPTAQIVPGGGQGPQARRPAGAVVAANDALVFAQVQSENETGHRGCPRSKPLFGVSLSKTRPAVPA